MRKKIIFFGDSIIKYNKNKLLVDWGDFLRKKIILNFPNKYTFYSKTIVGLNSTQGIKAFKNLDNNVKTENAFLIVQIGINDSWHYESLKGKPNVNLKTFKSNLLKIINKSNKIGIKEIFFISYHYLLNNRREINKMTLNQNLHKYIKLLKKICYREKVKFIDIFKHTRNMNSKKLCRPMPDGVHLSLNGAQIYSKIIFKNMKKYL
tara:strand:+ start:1083 stop:1700 length:618 start_codon:yes stop_codon:yes gene_type:complete